MEPMTREQLIKAAISYDLDVNEGGEGDNPYRDELERRAAAGEMRPMSRDERKDAIIAKIISLDCADAMVKMISFDCAAARNLGVFKKVEVDNLRAELKKIEAEEAAELNVQKNCTE